MCVRECVCRSEEGGLTRGGTCTKGAWLSRGKIHARTMPAASSVLPRASMTCFPRRAKRSLMKKTCLSVCMHSEVLVRYETLSCFSVSKYKERYGRCIHVQIHTLSRPTPANTHTYLQHPDRQAVQRKHRPQSRLLVAKVVLFLWFIAIGKRMYECMFRGMLCPPLRTTDPSTIHKHTLSLFLTLMNMA